MSEHDLKLKYISSMSDKYDYRNFESFCVNNNFYVPPFHVYALMVDPPEIVQNIHPKEAFTDKTEISPCNTCGGGEVR